MRIKGSFLWFRMRDKPLKDHDGRMVGPEGLEPPTKAL